MKKILAVLLVIAASVAFISGCNNAKGDIINVTKVFEYSVTGDDLAAGAASRIELRHSTDLATAQGWDGATRVYLGDVTKNYGEIDSITVTMDIETGVDNYFVAKLGDEVQPFWSTKHWNPDSTAITFEGRNWSGISNIVNVNVADTTAPFPPTLNVN